MPSLKKIEENDIQIGVPIDKPIYDKHGRLLITAGGSIDSEHNLRVMLEKEIYFAVDENPTAGDTAQAETIGENADVFAILDTTKIRLKRLFDLLRDGKAQEEFLSRIEDAAHTVQKACAQDVDAALANLHIENDFPYTVLHHLQAAILCEIVGKKLGVKDEARLKLIKAALSYDIDLLDIQHVLDRQTIPLSDQHIERIRNHPKSAAQKLRQLGVSDNTWLDAVEHHHERLDGTGYGDRLTGNAISIPARILAIADIYSAMIRNRANRKAILSKEALRKLMKEHGGKIDNRLTQILIKEIGVFPPGTLVQLANKEIAVVKSRQEDSIYPIVYSFVNESGKSISNPFPRDSAAPEFKIIGIVPFTEYLGSFNVIRSIWITELKS